MRKFKPRALSILLAGAAMVATTMVSAQGYLEEIVVTAQKRSENLQDVPISISAFTGESLDALGINTIGDLAVVTPGLNFNYIAGGANPYLRGVGGNSVSPGNEIPVAVYFDGAYNSYNLSAAMFEFLDIERVEILKGPQGTLFGRNATGGAINVVTLQPGNELEAQVEATYGRFDDVGVKAYLSGPISSENSLYGSISVLKKESDGYVKNVNVVENYGANAFLSGILLNPNGLSDRDVGYFESDAVRVKLRWEPSDDFAVTLIADDSKVEDAASGAWVGTSDNLYIAEAVGSLLFGLPTTNGLISREPHTYNGSTQPLNQLESEGFNLTIDWATEFGDIKYIGAKRDSKYLAFLDADYSPLNIVSYTTNSEVESMIHELQITSNNDGGMRWIAGLFYMDDTGGFPLSDGDGVAYNRGSGDGILYHVFAPMPLTPAGLAGALGNGGALLNLTGSREVESFAAFGEVSFDVSDNTELTFGLRYTDEEQRYFDGRQEIVVPSPDLSSFVALPAPISTIFPEDVQSYDEVTWSAIAEHDFSGDMMGYLSYKRGFKAGAYNLPIPGVIYTEPEIIDAYELGFKSTLMDGAMRFNAAAFFYDYDNLQVQRLEPTLGTVVTENAAAAEILGAEMSLNWLANDNLTFSFNLSVLDHEYTDFPDAVSYFEGTPTSPAFIPGLPGGVSNGTVNLSGQPLPFASDLTGNFSVNYIVPLQNSNLSFDANLYYSDGYVIDHQEAFIIDSYESLDASVTWKHNTNGVYVQLWGNNLTDEIRPGCNAPIFTGNACSSTPPATYGITLGYEYGK